MTERGQARTVRTADAFTVADSTLAWRGDALEITLVETTAPIPSPLRGAIRVTPHAAPAAAFALDADGRHAWTPIAPRCTVSATFTHPSFAWRGAGYLDANFGEEPLEAGFRHWDWSRMHAADGALVTYRTTPRCGAGVDACLAFDAAGDVTLQPLAPLQRLAPTVWRIPRTVRADSAAVRRTLEDAPFYARSELQASLAGAHGAMMHESLDLDRFSSAWVRALLPVRMPRRP